MQRALAARMAQVGSLQLLDIHEQCASVPAPLHIIRATCIDWLDSSS